MADKSSTPKVISPIYHSLNQASRLRSRRWLNVGIILLVIAAVIAGSLFVKDHDKKGGASAERTVRLVYTDPAKGQVYLADNTGKVLANSTIPVNSYASYEALSTDGSALVAVGSPGPQEDFLMVGGSQIISDDSEKALKTADYQGGSHNFVFIDDSTLLYTVCAPKTTCKIDALNLATGKSHQVADTGLQAQTAGYCYLLGKSPDGRTVYLRVSGQNKLGKSTSAVYQVDASHGKVLETVQVPAYAGFDMSLSPDGKTLAYSGGTTGKNGQVQAVIYLLDADSGKQTSVKWEQAGPNGMVGRLEWSPDGKKLLMLTAAINTQAGSKQAPTPIYLAYLDTSTNQITNLLTVTDTRLNSVLSGGWLNDEQVVYDRLVATSPSAFTTAKSIVYKQDISSKNPNTFSGPRSRLLKAAF